jgi:hypothetical protein
VKSIAKLLAWLSLATCLLVPYLFFQKQLSEGAYQAALAVASLAWFVFATYGLTRRA